MRTVFVLSGLGAGGAEKVVNLLAHHRRARGDFVHVLAINANSTHSYFPYDGSITIEALGKQGQARGVRASLSRLIALRQRLRAIKPELVVSFLTKVNVLVGLATLGLDTTTIMSERNNFMLQKMNPFWRSIAPLTARSAAALVMQTELAQSLLPKRLRERAVVIPNPVALPETFVGCARDGMRFVAAGRFERQKGFDLLLEAFSRVAKQVPSATLVIFGEGSERAALERQAQELGIADHVSMPGVTNSPGDWVSAGDVFVLSSRFEGFPNVLLEALMAGMATVAFDCPWGPAEIMHDPDIGLLVPLADVDRFAEALVCLATDLTLRRRLAAAAPRAAARYAKPRVLAQWDELIATVARGRTVNQAAPG